MLNKLLSPLALPAHAGLYANLATGLIGYWALDEASGSATDATGRGNTLTASGSPVSGTGILSNARQFVAASSQSLSIADNADVSLNGTDFTISAWVNLDSKTLDRIAVSKYESATGGREYLLGYQQSSDRFRFVLSGDGSTVTSLSANNLGSPSITTWYHLVGWYNSVAQTMNIQVNGGTVNSVSFTAGVLDGTRAFRIGAQSAGAAGTLFFDGRIDEVGIWKRVLKSYEIAALYNAGAAFKPL